MYDTGVRPCGLKHSIDDAHDAQSLLGFDDQLCFAEVRIAEVAVVVAGVRLDLRQGDLLNRLLGTEMCIRDRCTT